MPKQEEVRKRKNYYQRQGEWATQNQSSGLENNGPFTR